MSKTLTFSYPRRVGCFFPNYLLYLPWGWDLVLLGTKVAATYKLVYLYNDSYFFKFPLLNNFIRVAYDAQTATLLCQYRGAPNDYAIYMHAIRTLFYSFSKLFFQKLKFKGKGYYIFKNTRNTITPQFGHAHRIYLYAFFLSTQFLSKTTVFLFGTSRSDVVRLGLAVKALKPINIFTGRGVRFSRQVVYKKMGKVSSYK